MRSYAGMILNGKRVVVVRDRVHGHPRFLTHHRRDSDSFSWGSLDPGSIELARCLLLDCFGVRECPSAPSTCQCTSAWVDDLFRMFAESFILRLPLHGEWVLDQVDIADWAFDHRSEVTALSQLEALV